ncbi:MAG: hypothetical protein H8D96_13580 [Desulfobacterales bacterium]|uniref:Uncharacterized protein n=1 Tax=Candidatus Desulfatibia vada TaxID=2841696 RepID=A0A8J6TMV2_9BACT|nr:hypothetical protein [Candidatus Desulfatibia vada]
MKRQNDHTLLSAFFVCNFLLIFYLFSIHYQSLTKNDDLSYNKIINQFKKKSPKILFLGDSHTGTDISKDELDEKYFNFAHGSDNIRQMFLKLDYAIKTKTSIQYVVIPLDYHTFSAYRHRNRSFSRDINYTTNYPLIADLYGINKLSAFKELLSRYIPLLSVQNWEKYFLILTTKGEEKIFHEEKIKNANWDQLTQSERVMQTKTRVKEQLSEPIVVKDMVNIFDKFIAYCETKNTKLIGVRFPVSAEYIRTSGQYGISKAIKIFEERKNKFHFYLDYYVLFKNNPEFFINSDHLSTKGAEVFTKILMRDIDTRLKNDQ